MMSLQPSYSASSLSWDGVRRRRKESLHREHPLGSEGTHIIFAHSSLSGTSHMAPLRSSGGWEMRYEVGYSFPAVIPSCWTPSLEITCKRYFCFELRDEGPSELNWIQICPDLFEHSNLELSTHNTWCNWDSSTEETEIAKQTHFSKLCEWTLLCILVLNLEAEYYTQNWISICGNCKIAICKSCSFVYQKPASDAPKIHL